ncbi:MAG TPA: phosphatidylserine decarboxylase [Verrucomicrobiae bacterium]|jgi:phosphatidylserine decarboxylase|nr:phosphatidylserine decarboxylase [Verrucomicrobiae bacterium]
MKHAGKARHAALKLIFVALILACALAAIGGCLRIERWAAIVVATLWLLFALFTFYFFRDPNARTPQDPGLVVAPGHGKVDLIEQLTESKVTGGPCHRVSIFLSVIDIHVQNAPISGKIAGVTRTNGQFMSALKSDCAAFNENVLIEFNSVETPGEKIGLKLIAGVLARRIVPFVEQGDELRRGERISLIQFGSRCDLFLPLTYQLKVNVGQKVVGGETVVAAKA